MTFISTKEKKKSQVDWSSPSSLIINIDMAYWLTDSIQSFDEANKDCFRNTEGPNTLLIVGNLNVEQHGQNLGKVFLVKPLS